MVLIILGEPLNQRVVIPPQPRSLTSPHLAWPRLHPITASFYSGAKCIRAAVHALPTGQLRIVVFVPASVINWPWWVWRLILIGRLGISLTSCFNMRRTHNIWNCTQPNCVGVSAVTLWPWYLSVKYSIRERLEIILSGFEHNCGVSLTQRDFSSKPHFFC